MEGRAAVNPEGLKRYFDSLGVKTVDEAIARARADVQGTAEALGVSTAQLQRAIEQYVNDSAGKARMVTEEQLIPGQTYFQFGFFDLYGLIPSIETIEYVGKDLYPDDRGRYYFELMESGLSKGPSFSPQRLERKTLFALTTLDGVYQLADLIWNLEVCETRRRSLPTRPTRDLVLSNGSEVKLQGFGFEGRLSIRLTTKHSCR